VGAVVFDARVAPQAELEPGMLHDAVGHESQPHDAAARACLVVQPTIELPTHPVADRRRGQQAVMAPGAVELLPSLGDCLDAEARAGQTVPGQPLVQPDGERAGGERGGVDPVQRLVEPFGDIEVGRWLAGRERPFVAAGGQPVDECRVEAEPGQHVRRRQGGELPERTDAEPTQQVDEGLPGGHATHATGAGGRSAPTAGRVGGVATPDRGDIEVGQERRCRTIGDDPTCTGGQPGREHAVGDAGLCLDGTRLGDLLDEVFGGSFLAAEVTGRTTGGERAHAGAHHVDAGCDRLDGRDDRLKCARVPGLVVLDGHDLRAACLGLAFTETETDAFAPGRRRARDHTVRGQHGNRCVRRHTVDDAGGGHWPVRAPEHQRPAHEAASRRA
jgi:hypothetical protein